MSQEQLAFLADSKRKYISEVELGKRNVSLDFIGKLARALEVHPAIFLLNTEEAFRLDLKRKQGV